MRRLTFGIALDFGSKLRPLSEQLSRQSALLEAAEGAGFEIVVAGETAWAGSFHLPNALLVLASLAPRTGMRLCTGILLLPAWPLEKLAVDTAELDQLSGGRLILGIGLGQPALQRRAGWAANAVGETVDETLEALRTLWAGGAQYEGTHIRASGALPILPVQGGAIKRSARRAARLGDGWYGGVNFRVSQLPAQAATYREAGGAGGVVVNRVTLVAGTGLAIEDQIDSYLGASLAGYGRPDESLHSVLEEVALVGTPDHVARLLERYVTAGVTHIFTRLSLDETPPEVARTTIALLGREVIPHFAS